jgi:tetratricopeptide (TPR) repeat protein
MYGATGNFFGPVTVNGRTPTELARTESARTPIGRVWTIPTRTALFTGREELLQHVRAALTPGRPAVIQAIHGMGGVGKTSTAIEYAHRYAADYDIGWWLNAEDKDLVPDQLAVLARAMNLVNAGDPIELGVARLLGALQRRDRWLLIFDNAEDPQALARFLPTGNGHVLITSRNPSWAEVADPVEVDMFTREESVRLVRRRAPDVSDRDASLVAETVGDLPLAVDQTAALLAETGLSVDDYLRLVAAHTSDLWRRQWGALYPVSVAASWQVAFDRIGSDEPAALQLITLLSWLAPEPVPRTLLAAAATVLPAPLSAVAADPLRLAEVVGLLRRHSAIRINDDALILHRVPSALLRERSRVEAATPNTWETITARILRDGVPKDPWDNAPVWAAWRSLLPHVLVVCAPQRDLKFVAGEVSWLLNRAGIYLRTRGELQAALPLFERAYRMDRDRLGVDHSQTLESANDLAAILSQMGEHRRARDLNEDTLARRRHALGDDHADVLVSANNLALDLRRVGEYDRAWKLDKDTFARRRRVLGDDHPDTLDSATNLAIDLRQAGEYQQALELDEDTLARRQRMLGNDHPATLWSASNLALDLREVGEYERASELSAETLNRRRRVLGDDHPNTLDSANNLALDLRQAGEYEQARRLNEGTLAKRRRVLGDDHPDTLWTANSLVLDLRQAGEYERALELSADTFTRRRQVLGDSHPDTLNTATSLAFGLRQAGERTRAEELDEYLRQRRHIAK